MRLHKLVDEHRHRIYAMIAGICPYDHLRKRVFPGPPPRPTSEKGASMEGYLPSYSQSGKRSHAAGVVPRIEAKHMREERGSQELQNMRHLEVEQGSDEQGPGITTR